MHAPEQPDLARKAVVVGAAVAAVVVFVALLTAVWGPGPVGDTEAAPTHLGSAAERGGRVPEMAARGSDSGGDSGGDSEDGDSEDGDSGDGDSEDGDSKDADSDSSDEDPDSGSGGGSAGRSDAASSSSSSSGSSSGSGTSASSRSSGGSASASASSPGSGVASSGSARPTARPSAGSSARAGTSSGSAEGSAAGAGSTSSRSAPGSKVRPLPSFGTRARQRTAPGAEGDSGSTGGATSGSTANPPSGSASGTATSGTATPGTAGPGTAPGPQHSSSRLSCTVYVVDESGLDRALASAGASDVICVKGGLGSGTAGPRQAPGTPTDQSRPAAPALPSLPSLPDQAPRADGSGPAASGSAGRSGRVGPRSLDDVVGGSTGGATGGSTGDGANPASAAAPGPGTPDQDGCTVEVTDSASFEQALGSAKPGDKVCVKVDDLGVRLEIGKGGAEGSPIQIVGNGRTSIKGITVTADNVVVDGFTADQPEAPGIEITGNGVTVQNNTVTRPKGGDGDGLRFFGNDIAILHNRIGQTGGCGGCHADCMQTFTSGRPASENVRIEGNSCEQIANICLMAEGPGDVGDGGGGDGTSANWTLDNNTCEFGASQGYMIEAVQNVTMTNNEFTGEADKAIGLDIGSTGAMVSGNRLNGVANEVGMDSSSKKGYQGPEPHGGP